MLAEKIKNELKKLQTNEPKNPHHTKFIYNKYKEIIDSNTIFIKNTNFNQKVYSFINNITEFPICLNCEKIIYKFSSVGRGYKKYCSQKCGNIHNENNRTKAYINNINFKSSGNKLKDYKKLIKYSPKSPFILLYFYKNEINKFKEKYNIKTNNKSELIYMFIFDITSTPLCKCCNKNKLKFRNINYGFNSYCSQSCIRKSTYKNSVKTVVDNFKFNYTGNIKENFDQINSLNKHTHKSEILYKYYKKEFDSINFKNNMPLDEKLYCLLNNINKIQVCQECNKELKFTSLMEGYGKYCSYECSRKNVHYTTYDNNLNECKKIITNDIKKDFIIIKEFTKDNNSISPYKLIYDIYKDEIENKTNFITSNNIVEKVYCVLNNITTPPKCLKCGEILSFSKANIYHKFCSVECSSSSESTIINREKSCIEKYGVSNPMKVNYIYEKTKNSMFATKDYTLPSGKIVKIQGYEPYALDILFKMGYKEEDIILDLDLQPEIFYNYKDNIHRHYPDIFIPKENLIIEVKSEWTINIDQDKIKAKQNASIDLGYDYKIWLISENGELLNSNTLL